MTGSPVTGSSKDTSSSETKTPSAGEPKSPAKEKTYLVTFPIGPVAGLGVCGGVGCGGGGGEFELPGLSE